MKAVLSFGYGVFAIQDGGQCFGSDIDHETYNHYGPSTECSGDGMGGPLANNVYDIRYGNFIALCY